MTSSRACLAALVLALLVAPQVAATHPEPDPRQDWGRVWTVFTTLEADIVDDYATVRVIADIGNRGPDPEFPFKVTIPDDAFVTGLTIERDGVVYEARIEERAAARQEYEDWKHQANSGGLVEKARTSSTYAFLVNVAEFESVRATLTYERYLPADRAVHTLDLIAPVSGFGEDLGGRFAVTLRHSDGIATAWGSSGQATRTGAQWQVMDDFGPRRDDAGTAWSVQYMVAEAPPAGTLLTRIDSAGVGHFVHVIRATNEAEDQPIDLVLALDVSGSMTGQKAAQMKDAAAQVIRQLDDDDRLHLVFFSGNAESTWDGLRLMTPQARQQAADEVGYALIGGGTNIEAALRQGFAAFDVLDPVDLVPTSRYQAFVLLTDGQASQGEQSRDGLVAIANKANGVDAGVFALAFGDDADWGLVRALAESGDGLALRVPAGAGAEVDLERFLRTLTGPVLTNVQVDYSNGVRLATLPGRVLFAGSELLAVGSYDAAKGIGGTITATGPDGAVSWPLPAATPSGPTVTRLSAYHEIRQLQGLIEADGASADWVDRITALAVQHGFVTDYTSLVLKLPEQDQPRPAWGGEDDMAPAAAEQSGSSSWRAGSSPSSADASADGASTGGRPAAPGSSEPDSVATYDGSAGEANDARTGEPGAAPQPGDDSLAVPGAGVVLVIVAAAAVALARSRRGSP